MRSSTQGLRSWMRLLVKVSWRQRDLGYVNKVETPINGETIFVKGKEETPNPIASSTHHPNAQYAKSQETLKIGVLVCFSIGIKFT